MVTDGERSWCHMLNFLFGVFILVFEALKDFVIILTLTLISCRIVEILLPFVVF